MREIKFRAWDKRRKNWTKNVIIDADGLLWWQYGYQINERGPLSEDDYDIQFFTGLHDKNGKEIWEGDLLRRSDRGVDEVFYRGDQGQFMVLQRSPDEICDDVLWRFVDDSEVIGNIHENHDLI
jgi:uncharacterized phage protein (TIGR01671 family)